MHNTSQNLIRQFKGHKKWIFVIPLVVVLLVSLLLPTLEPIYELTGSHYMPSSS